MKKVLVAVAVVMSLGSGMTMAATSALPMNKVYQEQTADEYAKIGIKDIPEIVMQTVEKNHPGCYFFEAYVGYQGGQKVYKIELIDQAGESFFVKVDEQGNSIK